MLQDGAYLNALLELFSDLEDLEDDTHLPLLAKIMRNILFLNDTKLMRLVLQDDVFLRVAGCLECELRSVVDVVCVYGRHVLTCPFGVLAPQTILS